MADPDPRSTHRNPCIRYPTLLLNPSFFYCLNQTVRLFVFQVLERTGEEGLAGTCSSESFVLGCVTTSQGIRVPSFWFQRNSSAPDQRGLGSGRQVLSLIVGSLLTIVNFFLNHPLMGIFFPTEISGLLGMCRRNRWATTFMMLRSRQSSVTKR